ncbi:MAG: 6-carboxytetrahydropterin synthase [bacterium]
MDNSENPTAEKFAEEFAEKIMDLYNVEKVDVKVWETEKNLAGFTLEKLPRNY